MKKQTETVRMGLAQMNPTVGDLEGNAAAVHRIIKEAKGQGVQVLAFPELMLSGYPPEDLLLKPQFLADCEAVLRRLAHAARGMAVLLGAPEPPAGPGGKPFNTCCLLYRGKVAARYRKINLPNYGVFDEKRYFEPGKRALVVNFGATAFAINICEDMWMDDGPTPDQVAYGGARIVINISASPYHRRKGPERERLMRRRARENSTFLCYVNLVGAQDELIFDGSSVVAGPDGRTIARGRPFEEDLIVTDIRLPVGPVPGHNRMRRRTGSRGKSRMLGLPQPVGQPRHELEVIRLPALPSPGVRRPLRHRTASHLKPLEEVYRALVLGTRDYVEKNGFNGVVLGLSGGIDSALVAAIAFDALGPERVHAVTMPSAYTSRETLADARRLAGSLRINLFEIPIGTIYDSYLESLDPVFAGLGTDVTEENVQARIRGNLLMALSNKYGWLVLATGNKSEVAVGYCTLYGDMAGGFAVLKDVPKTLVYSLSRYRNRIAESPLIPPSIIRRRPTAELKPGQFDQDMLPPYPELDRIIELYVERDMAVEEIVRRGLDPETVRSTIRMIDLNEYKRRQGPPGIKITPKAFGRDRRLPITNRYSGAGRSRKR
ncbi:MAG: NAD+ synthase [bacterium]|nr:MAG: NAD+ synthase [bacterium]